MSGGHEAKSSDCHGLACKPKILLADEPTTALDVTIQAQVLDLVRQLQKELKTSMILITHDLGSSRNREARAGHVYGQDRRRSGGESLFYRSLHP